MTFYVSEVIRSRLGWCPNADARPLREAPLVLATPPATTHPARPDGGAGRSGRIYCGIELMTGSIRFLARNKWLFWFSLLFCLVMTFNLASSMYLQVLSGSSLFPGANIVAVPTAVMIVQGSIPWIALTFIVSFVDALLTYYLLAALIASVSLIFSGRSVTLRDGLAHTTGCMRPLVSWAMIAAVIGTVFLIFTNSSMTPNGTIGNPGIIYITILFMTCFYALTLFVVPVLVLANKDLIAAIAESVYLFRNLWGEIVVCFISYFLIVFVVMLISVISIIAIGLSAGSAAAIGMVIALYLLGMLVLLFIGSTLMGITITGLYFYGKTGTLPAMFDGKQTGTEYA